MVMSIAHRITGVILYGSTALLAWWLAATAAGADAYDTAASVFGSIIGLIVLFAITWAFTHHMLGGLRHFVWDTGNMMGRHISREIAIATPFVSAGLTVLLWFIAFIVV